MSSEHLPALVRTRRLVPGGSAGQRKEFDWPAEMTCAVMTGAGRSQHTGHHMLETVKSSILHPLPFLQLLQTRL